MTKGYISIQMLKPLKTEIRKPVKTISGITPVAVILPPRKCKHGSCVYCPNLGVPQSYTPKSPAIMRAMNLNYNAFEQVKARIKSYQVMNHPTEKIELIIMGGTFLDYPLKFQYNFIKQCYDALNQKVSKNLEKAQKLNEKA
ncbi:MAG: tRNA uridine(34) 5-carboxymethylaminomethyl modification radical SAM/GNAT enzyme Elp3, partial [archaeon]|nr:tRNA uridine(34) 5-carboxymethylaminomethyl modification radical SAM/GNAT enzyme Elp3 [archaeon]